MKAEDETASLPCQVGVCCKLLSRHFYEEGLPDAPGQCLGLQCWSPSPSSPEPPAQPLLHTAGQARHSSALGVPTVQHRTSRCGC